MMVLVSGSLPGHYSCSEDMGVKPGMFVGQMPCVSLNVSSELYEPSLQGQRDCTDRAANVWRDLIGALMVEGIELQTNKEF